MKTLIVTPEGSLEILDIPIPKISPRQALVKTIACGICGTDAKLIHRGFKGFPREIYPVMLGHEGVGCVVETGSEVKSFRVGDVVLLPFANPPEELSGSLSSGWGAFSEYGVVEDAAAYAPGEAPEFSYAQQTVPDNIDPVDAAMLVTLREVLGCIRYFGIKPGDSIAVFGSGPVALTFVRLLRLYGIDTVIAVGRSEEKKKLLMQFGAAYVLNSSKCDIEREIRKICPSGVRFALDAVGSPEIINRSMGLICDRGEILCYGVSEGCEMKLDWRKAPYNWKLNFQQMPSKLEESLAYEQILEWIRSGDLSLREFISDYFEFEDILEAFGKFAEHRIQGKGIVVY